MGILKENRVATAVIPLKSRASIALALQSGPQLSSDSIEEVVPQDLVFAAMLDAGRAERRLHPDVADGITTAFADSRLANQSRAYLAALASRRPEYLSKALAFLSRVDGAKLHFPELLNALDAHFLFEHRNVLANWIGSPGSSSVIGVIAERGGPEWIEWFGHMASAGKISHVEALGAALGCGIEIPVWGESALDELLTKSPWLTRACTQRGANRTLARFIASNYDRLIEGSVSGSTGYYQRNQVLVTCGDDDVFERLLQDFPLMSSRAQEMVSYAVVARGPKWIAAFQRIAFARPKNSGSHHQLLTEQFSPSIDEAAGRTWIDAGHYEAGWRVVIAHRGLASLPELLAQLPDSLGGHPNLPALHVMQYIKDPPAALTLELWRRLSGQMQPRVTQDLIQALATVDSHGMVSIVHMISAAKGSFPAAFLPTVAGLYEKWRQKHGRSITLRLPSGVQQPFERWPAVYSVTAEWSDHFTPYVLRIWPDLAKELVLSHLATEPLKCEKILSVLELAAYDAALLSLMLAKEKLAALIPKVFARCFDTFPAEALQACVDHTAINQDMLLYRLTNASNPLHATVLGQLIKRQLRAAPNLYHHRYLAGALAAYSRFEILNLFETCLSGRSDSALFLIREVEQVRGERLIDEAGGLVR
jgi:hypothetical protein